MDAAEPLTVRIDRWLWAARLYKTRSQATRACVAGHVKHNDAPAKAAKVVRVGDRIEAATPGGQRVLLVKSLSDKRGPAAVARELYDDHSPPPPPRDDGFVLRDRGAGRPAKRERRILTRVRGR